MSKKAKFKCYEILKVAEEMIAQGDAAHGRIFAGVLIDCCLHGGCEFSLRCERAAEKVLLDLAPSNAEWPSRTRGQPAVRQR